MTRAVLPAAVGGFQPRVVPSPRYRLFLTSFLVGPEKKALAVSSPSSNGPHPLPGIPATLRALHINYLAVIKTLEDFQAVPYFNIYINILYYIQYNIIVHIQYNI